MPNNKIIDLELLSRFKDNLDIELEKKANVDGNYPTLTVGLADNFTPYSEDSGATDTTPFVMQTSGGESDIGSQAYLKSLKGNSVAFNQLALALNSTNYYDESGQRTFNTTNNSSTYTADGTETAGYRFRLYSSSTNIFKRYSGHKYLITFKSVINTSITVDKYRLVFLGQNYNETFYTDGLNNWLIATPQYTDDGRFTLTINLSGTATSGDTWTISNLMIIDLTLMFGAGNEPTSVLEFNRLFPKSYYEYNVGTLLSCKVNGIKNVGYNAFDGELEVGALGSNGEEVSTSNAIRSSNFIKVISGQKYTYEITNPGTNTISNYMVAEYDENKNFIISTVLYSNNSQFELSNNTRYVRFSSYCSGSSTISGVQIAFHLTWDESRTGYEPYESETYQLPNVELRAVNDIKDELLPDGTLTRRIGSYTFTGNESFSDWQGDGASLSIAITGLKAPTNQNNVANVLWTKGKTVSYYQMFYQASTVSEYDICVGTNQNRLYIKTTKTSNELKTALAGTTIYFELATPTTKQQTEYTFAETTPIDDYGTQEFLYDSDIDITVPQGNEFFYPVDYKAFIDSLGGREDIEYAANQVVSQTQLANYLKTISGYDATKTQTLKNVNGTLTWVDDE